MKRFWIAALAIMLAGGAHAATLTFDGNICSGLCANGSAIDQSYGDMTGVDVVYDADINTPGLQNLSYWGAGYEDLHGVAWSSSGQQSGLSITFMAESGYSVSLSSLEIAPYADRVRNTSVRILDLATGSLVASSFYAPLSIMDSTLFTGSWTSTVGLQIILGPDAYDVGIDNIVYDAFLTPVAAVPLPAGAWLLMGGLAGLAALRRRRG